MIRAPDSEEGVKDKQSQNFIKPDPFSSCYLGDEDQLFFEAFSAVVIYNDLPWTIC